MSKAPVAQRELFGLEAIAMNAMAYRSPVPGHLRFQWSQSSVPPDALESLGIQLESTRRGVELGSMREEDLRRAAPSHATARLLLAAHAAYAAPLPHPRIMGILNVTPDSFSDGGHFESEDRACEHGLRLAAEGADIIDVGGESTRPGASPVSVDEELARVLPVIRALAGEISVPISIDTTKPEVAEAALQAGASWVNDVRAGEADERMLCIVREHHAQFVLMHSQGTPESMQSDPTYKDPLDEVSAYLRRRAGICLEAGIQESQLIIDPGIGFGKRLEHNIALLRGLPQLRSLGLPILVGVSRKSFIGHITGREKPQDWSLEAQPDQPNHRLGGTAAALATCIEGGAAILRVHDVGTMSEAAAVALALRDPMGLSAD